MAELVKIQFISGQKANLALAGNDTAKPVYCTDTQEVFIGDAVNGFSLVGRAKVGVIANRPAQGTVGNVFVATDENNTMYVDDGTSWVKSGVTNLSDLNGDLDDISDGTTYGKVLNTELDSGRIKQLWDDVASGTILASDIGTHLNNLAIHREINDAGNGANELWSANKIQSEINAVSSGKTRVKTVIDYVDGTAVPPTEVAGDRYILDFSGATNADWDGADQGDLVEFVSGSWVIKVDASDANNEGVITLVDAENQDRILINDGTPQWEARPTAIINHDDLNGLNAGEFQHLTTAEKTRATTEAGNGNGLGLLSDTDKTKLDGLEAGAQVNQDITAQNGVKRTDSNGTNGNAVIEADFGADVDVSEIKGNNVQSIGSSGKLAHSDHVHALHNIFGGTF